MLCVVVDLEPYVMCEDGESKIEGKNKCINYEVACGAATLQLAGSDLTEMAFASESDCGGRAA